jgi:hypothetical protein
MSNLTIMSVDGPNGVITDEERLEQEQYAEENEVGCPPSLQGLVNSLQQNIGSVWRDIAWAAGF